MRRIFLRFAAILVAIVVIGVGLLFLRNYQMDKGTSALKVGHGDVALERLTPLANLGDAEAQYLVGSIYAYGWGVVKSDEDAIYWFRRAAKGVSDEVDAAAPAALGVAKSYAEGTDGVVVNPTESVKWLEFAAKGGNKEAAARLTKP